jgi:hypothetical protein
MGEQVGGRAVAERLVRALMIVQLINTKPIMLNHARFSIHGTRGLAGRYGYTE